MAPGAPKLWNLTKRLPPSWRIALLRALAYPEYEVAKVLLHPDSEHPFGRVWLYPIAGSLIEEPYPCPLENRCAATIESLSNIVEFKR